MILPKDSFGPTLESIKETIHNNLVKACKLQQTPRSFFRVLANYDEQYQ